MTPHLRPRFFSFVLPVCLFVEGTPNASLYFIYGKGSPTFRTPGCRPAPAPRWSSCRTDTPARAGGQQGARPRHVRPLGALLATRGRAGEGCVIGADAARPPAPGQAARLRGELMRGPSLSARTEGPAHRAELSPGPPLRAPVASGTPRTPTARQPFSCCTSGAPAQTCPSFGNSWPSSRRSEAPGSSPGEACGQEDLWCPVP